MTTFSTQIQSFIQPQSTYFRYWTIHIYIHIFFFLSCRSSSSILSSTFSCNWRFPTIYTLPLQHTIAQVISAICDGIVYLLGICESSDDAQNERHQRCYQCIRMDRMVHEQWCTIFVVVVMWWLVIVMWIAHMQHKCSFIHIVCLCRYPSLNMCLHYKRWNTICAQLPVNITPRIINSMVSYWLCQQFLLFLVLIYKQKSIGTTTRQLEEKN